MIDSVRTKYNADFSEAQYEAFKAQLIEAIGEKATFRLAETPIFLPDDLAHRLLKSSDEISDIICDPDTLAATENAIRAPYWSVPGKHEHPLFLQYDFALCEEQGKIVPWLIELQGFPSLYFFQADLAKAFRQNLPVPSEFSSFFNGFSEERYVKLLRDVIIGDHAAESVVLLEIDPDEQNTRIDFRATRNFIQLPTVGLADIIREGRKLFYEVDGRKIQIKRVYNRVILDELLQQDPTRFAYDFKQEVDIEWAGHPDWFLRISKHTLPTLGHLENVPSTIFADNYQPGSLDLTKYVLKPLYSFSGAGVNIHPTEADVASLERPNNWIIQQKVNYGPILQTPTGKAKCEVRMMLIWAPGTPKPVVVNNLVRITKGEMTGVKYNKDRTWVGASVGMHRLP